MMDGHRILAIISVAKNEKQTRSDQWLPRKSTRLYRVSAVLYRRDTRFESLTTNV